MSRSTHPRARRPSATVTQRVARVLGSEQRTIASLAAELGVSPETVRVVLRRLGVRIEREPLPWRSPKRFVEVVRGPP